MEYYIFLQSFEFKQLSKKSKLKLSDASPKELKRKRVDKKIDTKKKSKRDLLGNDDNPKQMKKLLKMLAILGFQDSSGLYNLNARYIRNWWIN